MPNGRGGIRIAALRTLVSDDKNGEAFKKNLIFKILSQILRFLISKFIDYFYT